MRSSWPRAAEDIFEVGDAWDRIDIGRCASLDAGKGYSNGCDAVGVVNGVPTNWSGGEWRAVGIFVSFGRDCDSE
jgi:hypothetical protein